MRVPSVPGVFLHVQGRPAQWVISCWRDVGGERFRTTPVTKGSQWRKLASLQACKPASLQACSLQACKPAGLQACMLACL